MLGYTEIKIIERLRTSPFFIDDILDFSKSKTRRKQKDNIKRALRRLKINDYDVWWFNYKGQKTTAKRYKFKTPHFFIIYNSKQRKEAWELINRKFELPHEKFNIIARPLCGKLMKNKSRGRVIING